MVRRRSFINNFIYINVFRYKLVSKILRKKLKFLRYVNLIRRKRLFLRRRQYYLHTYFKLILDWSYNYLNYLKSLRLFVFFTSTYMFYLYVNTFSTFYSKFIFTTSIIYHNVFFKINLLMTQKSVNRHLLWINLRFFSLNFMFASKFIKTSPHSISGVRSILDNLNSLFFFNSSLLIFYNKFYWDSLNLVVFNKSHYTLLYSLYNVYQYSGFLRLL